MSLSVAEQRNKVVELMKSLEGKNTFSQSTRYRLRVDHGYGDSASTVQYVYRETMNLNIGTYIVSQFASHYGVDVDVATNTRYLPDESKLLPGDLLFFKSKIKRNPYQVGHVEMYIGDNTLMGHVKGKGPTKKDMIAFCKSRDAAGKGYIKAKRFILTDVLDQVSDELIRRLQDVLNTVGCKDKNHCKLNVDEKPRPSTLSACPVLKKGKENPVVAVMQEGLIELGYFLGCCGANGYYGGDTVKAVKQFEEEHHLKVDGTFGKDNWSVWLGL